MRRQVRPSVDSSTTPPRPTSQQTEGDGEAPAVRSALAPIDAASQVVPPLVVCSRTDRSPPMRQRTEGSGEVISKGALSVRDSAAVAFTEDLA